MLRGDNIICGTSSTSTTSPLLLAAVPQPPGGLDFDTWLRATGMGFGNSAAVLVSYTINEFSDTTFSKIKGTEKGVGLLTLGGSAGIANCTLTRTTTQYSVTGMDGVSPALSFGSAYSIGTAANTLVIIGPSAADVPAYHPYFDNGQGDTNWGVTPEGFGNTSALATSTAWNTGGAVRDLYQPFRWSVSMLVKRFTCRVQSFSTVVGSPILQPRIYAARSSDGRAGKLLYDFSAAGVAVTATGPLTTGASGNGFRLDPGDYWMDFCMSGLTSGTITLSAVGTFYNSCNPMAGRMGVTSAVPYVAATAAGASGAAPDPANLTSWSPQTISSYLPILFGLNSA